MDDVRLNIVERDGKRYLICVKGWEHCHLEIKEGESPAHGRLAELISMMEPGHFEVQP